MRSISGRLAAGLAAALTIVAFGPLAGQARVTPQSADQSVDAQRLDTRVQTGAPAEAEPRVSLPPRLTGLRGAMHMPRYRTSSALQPLTWIPSPSDIVLDETAGATASRGTRRATSPLRSRHAASTTHTASGGTASSPVPDPAAGELDESGPLVSMPPSLRGTRGEIRRAAYSFTATLADPTTPSGAGDPESRGKTIYGQGPDLADPGTGLDPEGWTILTKSPDTRVVYVSSSEGSDLNNGLSESTPVKTIAKGKSLVRMGFPDWLLLKSGDEWEESFGRWDLFGRSETERMVVSSYGEGPRPLLKSGSEGGLRAMNHQIKHVIIADLDFWANARDPSQGGFDPTTNPEGVLVLGGANDVTIEGCRFRMFHHGVLLQAWDGERPAEIRIRRNVIADSYSTTTHSQGLYAFGTAGLLIEENIIDHNGWNEMIAEANPTQFNHNIYIDSKAGAGTENLVIRGNILSNGSALGVKIWAGMPRGVVNSVVEENLFYACADGLRQHANTGPGSVGATVRNNVFTELGRSLKGVPQSFGILIGTMEDGSVTGNLLINKPFESPSFSIRLEGGTEPYRDLVISENIVYHWYRGKISVGGTNTSNVQIADNILEDVHGVLEVQELSLGADVIYSGNLYRSVNPEVEWFRVLGRLTDLSGWIAATGATDERKGIASFVDPMRSVDSYDQVTGGSGRGQELVARAREMDRDAWDVRLTGAAIVQYLRDGFTPLP